MSSVLIKCGGSILEELSTDFFSSLQELKKQGYQIVIVHGGGPDINKMLENLHVRVEYENGLRKTNEETLNVVEMVLAGQTNRKLVQKLTENGLKAIGLNGSDDILKGDYINKEKLGFVGDIREVNIDILQYFLQKDVIPVLTPIASGSDGSKLNVNADYAAAAVANAMQVDQCLFVTDVEGIMIDGKVKESIPVPDIENYISKGDIYGGMIPKVTSAMDAIQKGIDSVRIVAGKKCFFLNNTWYGTKIDGKESVIS